MEISNSNLVFYGTGRRKQASARVFLTVADETQISINGKSAEAYFSRKFHKWRPLDLVKEHFLVKVTVTGGGLHGQEEAVRLGISRALVQFNEEYRPILRQENLLTRDARQNEPGGRRPQQWKKR